MPLINILFWMMLLLTAYMTLSLLSAYYKAEREAQRQLLRLQARQRVRDQKAGRPSAAANHAARLVQPPQPPRPRRAKVPFRTGEEQMFACPVSRTCRFQQVAMTRERKDTANLSFDWTRPIQKSALTQQTGSGATCDQGQQSRHDCA